MAFEALEDYRKFRLSSRPVPVPANLAAGGFSTSSKIQPGENSIMSNPITLQSSPGALRDSRSLRHRPLGDRRRPTQACLWRPCFAARCSRLSRPTMASSRSLPERLRRPHTASCSTERSTPASPIPLARSRVPWPERDRFEVRRSSSGLGPTRHLLARTLRQNGIFVEGAIAPVALAAKAPKKKSQKTNAPWPAQNQ